jgi:NADH-quinone oxidoreductase subunit G
MRGIGSENVEFRLRQTDFALDGQLTPWLGMPIAELSNVQRVLVIGSFLRKDHPLVATRLRAAVKGGATLAVLNGADDELLIAGTTRIVAAPSDWLAALSGIVAALAAARHCRTGRFRHIEANDQARAVAASLTGADARSCWATPRWRTRRRRSCTPPRNGSPTPPAPDWAT